MENFAARNNFQKPPPLMGDVSLPTEYLSLPQDSYCKRKKGEFEGGYSCSQDLAYHAIISETHIHLKRELGLNAVDYDGDIFKIRGNDQEIVIEAIHILKEFLDCHRPKDNTNENTGTAPDLRNVRFNFNIKFVGERVCTFCWNRIQIGDRVRRTPCLHIFHSKCIKPWLSNKNVCPIDMMKL